MCCGRCRSRAPAAPASPTSCPRSPASPRATADRAPSRPERVACPHDFCRSDPVRIPELRRQDRRESLLRDDLVTLIERHFAADNGKAVETFGDEFAVLLRPRPQDAVYVDVLAPPPAEAVDLFRARWHGMRAEATADAAAAMAALEPRLKAALRDAPSIGQAAA